MSEEYETSYHRIEEFEAKNFEWHRSVFLKERVLFKEMIELILESFKPLSDFRNESDESQFAMPLLATRMFNDAEGAEHLLLWGLPDQAQPLIRDVIECTMLFRLFLREPKMAKRWLLNLAEYRPGVANAKLEELGIQAKEYAWYGPLSHTGHSNLLASLSHTRETDVGEQGTLFEFHFGGARTLETEYLIQVAFAILFSLLCIALCEPLAELYYERSESYAFSRSSEKVGELKPKVVELLSEIAERPDSGKSKVGDALWERTKNKLRFKDFERVLNELNGLPRESYSG
jgi:hypothetical protein